MFNLFSFCIYLIIITVRKIFPKMKMENIVYLSIIMNTILYALLYVIMFIFVISPRPNNRTEYKVLQGEMYVGGIIIYFILTICYSYNGRWKYVVERYDNIKPYKKLYLLMLLICSLVLLWIIVYLFANYLKHAET